MKKQSLISAFDDLLGPPIDKEIPQGFYSIAKIANRQGLDEKTIANKLTKLANSDKIERRQFRNENGRVCWFYRVK